jgi:hypothetical protein
MAELDSFPTIRASLHFSFCNVNYEPHPGNARVKILINRCFKEERSGGRKRCMILIFSRCGNDCERGCGQGFGCILVIPLYI